ncbi:MAG: VOC family protein [Acidobacteria bacterium]|nr:VOC family protein [Acidobacteriota bacterium]
MTNKTTRETLSVSTQGIFGEATGAQPATPGSYGRAPSGFRLPGETALGPVRLQIADLGRSLDYYQEVLGLEVLERTSAGARLGAPGGVELVELVERRGIRPVPGRSRTGLFHFAILLPDRASLGRFARHLGQLGVRPGAADHLVSEALYLQDSDNLGIEVYADRPRTAWHRIGRELMMATDPIDMAGLLAAAGSEPWNGIPAGTVMGHVHLHVGDLSRGAAFYSNALGFDHTVWGYPGALFLGAGGYHHHLGTNVWAGAGATPPPSDEAQLLEWTIDLPDPASLEAAAGSLEEGGFDVAREEDPSSGFSVTAKDSWGTAVRLRCAGSP